MGILHLNKYPNMHKALCGLFVALALVALPLPALATDDTSEAVSSTSNQQTANTPAQSALSETLDNTANALQNTANADPLPAISLPSSDSPNENSTTNPQASIEIDNSINSGATSGSAAVTGNTEAGNATSGNAAATATVLNVANANGLTANNFKTFECDITGDVQDNLVIDPTSLLPVCQTTNEGTANEAGNAQSLQSGASLVDILNNIVLSANSGNATVGDNTRAGDATSGDATALANIVNIANTAIGAKNSFLGVINIYGNLKGDILVPQSLVDSLIGNTASGNIPVDSTTINNTINASATSGEATVKENTVAGDATSGDATTNLTVFNLTGREVVAKNSLLVFVNVLGKWLGMIVPAPGSNTAMLGSEVQSNSATNISNSDQAGHSTTSITNNVTVEAQSGDANVTNNTEAGNATSGKARAGVNLLNITHSNFLLDDWFGALFINVLGSWLGDFDIQMSSPVVPQPSEGNTQQPIQDVRVYQFAEPAPVRAPATSITYSSQNSSRGQTDLSQTTTPTSSVLSTTDSRQEAEPSTPAVKAVNLDLFALGAIVLALTVLIAVTTMIVRRWHTA